MNQRWAKMAVGMWVAVMIVAVSAGGARTGAGRVPEVHASLHASPGAAGFEGGGAPRVFIEARGAGEPEILDLRSGLVAAGAENVNVFLPQMIVVCNVPAPVELSRLVDASRFSIMSENAVEASLSEGAAISDGLRFVTACYDRLQALLDSRAPQGAVAFDDVLRTVTPEEIARSRNGIVRGTGPALAPSEVQARSIQQNSEFLAGSVVVQLVFPESNGHSEDWTPETLADAAASASAGILAFQSRFGYARLSFTVRTASDVATSYEPIQTTMGDHPLWIHDLMTELGIPADENASLRVHEYNNRGRGPRADWVFTAFIANAVNDPNHRFADEYYTAYAFLGGPYLVIPYPAGEDPYGIGFHLVFSTVFQHEMSHVFWALDEYPGPINGSDCRSRTGYLNYANMNKVEEIQPGDFVGCRGEPQLCLMWRAKEDLGRPVCTYTQGQLGVADDNANSIPDVFDATPSVVFSPAAIETISTPDVTVSFTAVSNAVPNLNPMQDEGNRMSYAALLKDATFSINGSPPIYLDPIDGDWDETTEDLSVSVIGIPVGMTELQVVARNAYGRSSSDAIKRYYFPGIRFALFDVDPEPAGIRVSWSTVGESFGATLDLHRIASAESAPDTTRLAVNVQPIQQPVGLFRHYEFIDTEVVPGSKYRYFVKGYFDIVRTDTVHYEVTSEVFDAQSMLPIPSGMLTSHVSPNPFSRKTLISVRVPETTASSGASSAASAAVFLQTEVNVTVYDVAGRPVRKLHNGPLFSGVRTFEWDGTNESDEKVPSGVYFVKAIAGSAVDVKKVVVVR